METQDAEAAMEALQNAGVPAGVARRPSDLLEDPHYIERGFWQDIDRDVVGPKPHPLTPWRFDGDRGPLRMPAPLLGEYNRAVFCGILGMDKDEFAALEAADVIGDQPMVMD
jgi:crotonobetainyl-CoA:carnitine CoA-transferase CaiB-like acyl-CoA transferase